MYLLLSIFCNNNPLRPKISTISSIIEKQRRHKKKFVTGYNYNLRDEVVHKDRFAVALTSI